MDKATNAAFATRAESGTCLDTSQVRKMAVVTGANKGIGYHIAQQLAATELFDTVIMACRDSQRGQDAIQKLRSTLPPSNKTELKCLLLEVGNKESHANFRSQLEKEEGDLQLLVNNAGIYTDPTPLTQPTRPTLDLNFRATVDLTETLLPLLKKQGSSRRNSGTPSRVVNVSSQLGSLRSISSPTLRQRLTSPQLTLQEVSNIVDQYERHVRAGTHAQQGMGISSYGMSKLALIAATKVWAREHAPHVIVNACCPGYCKTDMTNGFGMRDAADGAKNAVIPATMENPPTGALFADFQVAEW